MAQIYHNLVPLKLSSLSLNGWVNLFIECKNGNWQNWNYSTNKASSQPNNELDSLNAIVSRHWTKGKGIKKDAIRKERRMKWEGKIYLHLRHQTFVKLFTLFSHSSPSSSFTRLRYLTLSSSSSSTKGISSLIYVRNIKIKCRTKRADRS